MRDLNDRLKELDSLLDDINELADIIAALNDPTLQSNYTEELLEYSQQFDSLCDSTKKDLEEYMENCRMTGAPVELNKFRLLKVINERK